MGKTKGKLTIYQKPTCTTCRETVKLVQTSGAEFVAVNYYETPFTKSKLSALLKKAGLKPTEVLRSKEDMYKKLKLAQKDLSASALLDLMVKYPDLIQRPLVEKGEQVILARPAETVKKLLK
jgi:arsenate reductase